MADGWSLDVMQIELKRILWFGRNAAGLVRIEVRMFSRRTGFW